MKRITFLLIPAILITFQCLAQGQSNQELVQYRSLNSELNAKSDTLHRRYFQKYEIDLVKNEMLLVKYSSPDYAVSLFVRNTKGDTLGSVEIPKYFNDKGSYLTYLFKQAEGGKYQLLLTSKDSLEFGKFTLNLAMFKPDENQFDDDWELCQKLDYLLQHSATDFQFVAGENVKGFTLTNTRKTDYNLITPSLCEIEYFTADVYVCTLLEKMNLEKCIQKMKELDYEIKKCLTPEWKKTEKRPEEVKEINKDRFVKELDYKLAGKPANDHNLFHEKYNLKYSVRFLIEKDLQSDYDFRIILE